MHYTTNVSDNSNGQLISTDPPLIRLTPDERVEMYAPWISTFPALVSVMLDWPQRSTISRSAERMIRSASSFCTDTVFSRYCCPPDGDPCSCNRPRIMGRRQSPSSNM